MSDSKPHPFSGKFWRSFEQFFGGQFPNMPLDKAFDPDSMEEWVQQLVRSSFPQASSGAPGQAYRTEVFETHNNVVVKVHVPDREEAESLDVRAGIRQVRLQRNRDKFEQVIRLAALVVPQSCRAVYKQGILQLHMRKMKTSDKLYDVYVQFKDD